MGLVSRCSAPSWRLPVRAAIRVLGRKDTIVTSDFAQNQEPGLQGSSPDHPALWLRRSCSVWRTGNDSKSSTTIACAASKGVTVAIGFPVQFSVNIYSSQPCQLFCCSAVFVGSVTLPAEHLETSCES